MYVFPRMPDAASRIAKFTFKQFTLEKPQKFAMYFAMRKSSLVVRAFGQIGRQLRHPATALFSAVILGFAAIPIGWTAFDQAQQFSSDDPVKISERALDDVFSRAAAEREIAAALAAGDLDLAQSFLDLSAERGVAIDPALADKVKQAQTEAASATHTAGRFVRGFWTGEPNDLASLAGTATGDLFVFGDLRDVARESTRYLVGKPVDPWILGIAGVGVAVTAGTYLSAGLGVPERIGLTLAKVARRTGRLNPLLAMRLARDAIKVEKAGGLVELVGDVGRIETKAGTQAALDGLKIAEEPRDVSRLARLSAAKGGKTRAIIKLLGRGAIMLAVTAFDVATWMLWAGLMLFGFVSALKAGTERMTLRYLHWRKRRRGRAQSRAVALSPRWGLSS
jgi:hypothetical protein